MKFGNAVAIQTVFFIFLPVIFIMEIRCGKKAPVYNVPPGAEIFVQRFVAEAKQRGRDIEVDNLIVNLKDDITHDGDAYCGCSQEKKGQKIIDINTSRFCWTSGDLYREAIMFHELGHTLLERDHDDSKLPNGDWASLMSSGLLDYYVYDSVQYKRNYYLDELFE